MDLGNLAYWASLKGIDLLGTADFTHPLWLRELKSGLEEMAEGIYSLKDSFLQGQSLKLSRTVLKKIKFVLTTEISSIYSQGGKARRIHNLLFAPDFDTVRRIIQKLKSNGVNLMADGRPMIGLSSKQLCELVWSVNEEVLLVPAHVWTPWYSLYGSKSGFDSIKECYGEFSDRIYAIETGLSSDPAMNWRIEELNKRSIVSFSDAHSASKLGREATVFKRKAKSEKRKAIDNFNFQDLAGAIRQDENSDWEVAYTIEFYPQEGKYHWTGHRKCGVVHSPEQTAKKGSLCPVCGRNLTVGVMHRVEDLAKGRKIKVEIKTNKSGTKGNYCLSQSNRPPFVTLVPLLEIIAESLGMSSVGKKVLGQYFLLTEKLGRELTILLSTPLGDIEKIAGSRLAEGIGKVRRREIVINPGYDGLFGEVKIWGEKRKEDLVKEQMSLL